MAKLSKKPAAKKAKIAKPSVSKSVVASSLKLREMLDIAYAERFFDELSTFSAKAKSQGILDASDVQRITTPCIQVLLSLFVKCNLENISIKIIKPSNNFKLAFEDLGLQQELQKFI